MPAITVRDVPEAVYTELKRNAAFKKRSLNGLVIDILTDAAAEYARRRRMRETRDDFLKFRRTLPRMDDSTALIREDRDSH